MMPVSHSLQPGVGVGECGFSAGFTGGQGTPTRQALDGQGRWGTKRSNPVAPKSAEDALRLAVWSLPESFPDQLVLWLVQRRHRKQRNVLTVELVAAR